MTEGKADFPLPSAPLDPYAYAGGGGFKGREAGGRSRSRSAYTEQKRPQQLRQRQDEKRSSLGKTKSASPRGGRGQSVPKYSADAYGAGGGRRRAQSGGDKRKGSGARKGSDKGVVKALAAKKKKKKKADAEGGHLLEMGRLDEDWKAEDPIFALEREKMKHGRHRSKMGLVMDGIADNLMSKAGVGPSTPAGMGDVEYGDDRDPGEYLNSIVIQLLLALLFIIICLSATKSGVVLVKGDVGASQMQWKYGFTGKRLILEEEDDPGAKDHFTKYVATDAGNMYLFAMLTGLGIVLFSLFLTCMRWQSGYLYYNEICGMRVLHRQTLEVLVNFFKSYAWMAMVWFLAVAFYGLIELNYYVFNYCGDGYMCSTEIWPDYGWLFLLAAVTLVSCCTYTSVRKIDPPLTSHSVKMYLPEHEEAAVSMSPPIKLHYLLEAQEAARGVLTYSLVVYFMKNSGLLLAGFTTTESGGLNIIGLLQPIGWQCLKTHPSFDNDSAKQLQRAGEVLGDVSLCVWVGAVCVCLGLMSAVKKYNCKQMFRSAFMLIVAILILAWIYGCGMFYYQAYKYWKDDGKDLLYTVDPTDVDESIKRKFLYPDWGVLVLLLNSKALYDLIVKGYKGFELTY